MKTGMNEATAAMFAANAAFHAAQSDAIEFEAMMVAIGADAPVAEDDDGDSEFERTYDDDEFESMLLSLTSNID